MAIRPYDFSRHSEVSNHADSVFGRSLDDAKQGMLSASVYVSIQRRELLINSSG